MRIADAARVRRKTFLLAMTPSVSRLVAPAWSPVADRAMSAGLNFGHLAASPRGREARARGAVFQAALMAGRARFLPSSPGSSRLRGRTPFGAAKARRSRLTWHGARAVGMTGTSPVMTYLE